MVATGQHRGESVDDEINAPPREGFPPCIVALVTSPEGRTASWTLPCHNPAHIKPTDIKEAISYNLIPVPYHLVQACRTRTDGSTVSWHGLPMPGGTGEGAVVWCPTDNKEKAKAAWKKAEHWVYSGIVGLETDGE